MSRPFPQIKRELAVLNTVAEQRRDTNFADVLVQVTGGNPVKRLRTVRAKGLPGCRQPYSSQESWFFGRSPRGSWADSLSPWSSCWV